MKAANSGMFKVGDQTGNRSTVEAGLKSRDWNVGLEIIRVDFGGMYIYIYICAYRWRTMENYKA